VEERGGEWRRVEGRELGFRGRSFAQPLRAGQRNVASRADQSCADSREYRVGVRAVCAFAVLPIIDDTLPHCSVCELGPSSAGRTLADQPTFCLPLRSPFISALLPIRAGHFPCPLSVSSE
jgi:hypothetical protein